MKGSPAGRYVLVEVEEVKEKTQGGLFLPQQTKDLAERLQDVGVIVDMGPLAFGDSGGAEEWGVATGDTVLFKRQGGIHIKYPGLSERLRVLNDEDILLRLEVTDG